MRRGQASWQGAALLLAASIVGGGVVAGVNWLLAPLPQPVVVPVTPVTPQAPQPEPPAKPAHVDVYGPDGKLIDSPAIQQVATESEAGTYTVHLTPQTGGTLRIRYVTVSDAPGPAPVPPQPVPPTPVPTPTPPVPPVPVPVPGHPVAQFRGHPLASEVGQAHREFAAVLKTLPLAT